MFTAKTTLWPALFASAGALAGCSSNDDSYEETLQIHSNMAACTALVETLCLT